MATYFVASGGSNTSPYDTWAKAATSLPTALAAATTTGDRVVIQYNAVPADDADVTADTNFTFAGNISLIAASNDGGSAYTPTPMGTANWIGTDTGAFIVRLAGAFRCYIYGITMRNGSTAADPLFPVFTTGACYEFDTCYFWLGTTNTGAYISLGKGGGDEAFAEYDNCEFRFSATAQYIATLGRIEINGGKISADGSAPTELFKTASGEGTFCTINGFDMSSVSGTLVGNMSIGHKTFHFSNCSLHASVVVHAAQTSFPSKATTDVYVFNSAAGDVHYAFAHYNGMGQTVAVTDIYASDGAEWNLSAAKYSWAITTTANATPHNPYKSPWLHKHHEGTSAITPNLEGFRDGSTTIIQDDEVWAEFSYQGTTNLVTPLFVNDRVTLTGTPANQTSSKTYSDWQTGTSADSTFKLATTSTITPSEIGNLSARVCVGEPSITVYVDPQVRT